MTDANKSWLSRFEGLSRHKALETADGSFTLYSEQFEEACHSLNGAKSETITHYIQGCEIQTKIASGPIHILEVGLGLGVGFLTTQESLKDAQHPWTFTSLELDRELVEWFFKEYFPNETVSVTENTWTLTTPTWSLRVLVGDARKTLPEFLKNGERFHAIYQDAFSPKKNPTLWTQEWFELLKSASYPDTIMSTYSSSSSIRKSMCEAGWKLYEGGKFGPKRSSTRARLIGETEPSILLHLQRSPALPLRDDKV